MGKITTEVFVERAKRVHGDKYDYSSVKYVNTRTPVTIICPIHGPFEQEPHSHLNGIGCSDCGGTKKLTTEEFIKRAKEIHGDRYDYSKTNYVNMHTKVKIICHEKDENGNEHGEFEQIAQNHLIKRECCQRCGEFGKLTTEEFIRRAKRVHGDKYDYSNTVCNGWYDDVEIGCPVHGPFKQKAGNHLQGKGCDKCGHVSTWDNRGRITTEEFIKKARAVHGDKYDYSKAVYVNNRTPIIIICHKKNRKGVEHGEFLQKPNAHLYGHGCRKCRCSSLEEKVAIAMKERDIIPETEKTFEWLKSKKGWNLYLDFYIPDYNVAIECQGIQHFIPIRHGKMTDEQMNRVFELNKENDLIKKKLCEENNIRILYFTNNTIINKWDNGLFGNMYSDINELMNDIINGK